MCFVDHIEPEIFIGYLDMIKGTDEEIGTARCR